MKAPVSALEDHLGFWLRALSNAVHRRFEESLREHGVSVAQWVALRRLYDVPFLSLNELAALMSADQSSVSRLLDRLVTKGLVLRVSDTADRRAVKLRLTDEATRLVPRLARAADANDNIFFGAISKAERRQFEKSVRTLVQANAVEMATSD